MKITCRICKIQQGEFFTLDTHVSIYGLEEYKLLHLFNKCCHLSAFLRDGLPQVVCLNCLDKLKEFFEFRTKAEKSDLEFRENLSKILVQEVNPESLDNFNLSRGKESDSVGAIKAHIEHNLTDDDLEEIEERINDDDEEMEDTDILFELYNKNDSNVERYLKFENNESKDIVDDNTHRKDDKEIKGYFPEIISIPLDNASSVEPAQDSKVDLLAKCDHIQTDMLEPLDEIRKWKCFECGRKYMKEEKLLQHRKLHNQSEDRQCKICGSHLKSLFEYGEHMKTHVTERKFSCEFCCKTFSTRANLKAHQYIHTNLRPFKCEICGKAFQQKSILKTHMTLHTGKPFACTLCHRRFSRTAHLNIHMRQHNNIRPYQCTQCPCSYMQKSHLDRHISSSHLGVRFQCSLCDKMYTKKPSLNSHMREAHGTTVPLYNCEICNLDFSKQKGFYYHLKSKHPDYKKK